MTGAAVLESIGLTRFALVVRLCLMWGVSIPLIYLTATTSKQNPNLLTLCWIIGSIFEFAIGVIYFWRIIKAIRNSENKLHIENEVAA